MIYSDGMEGGKEREDNIVKDVQEREDGHFEYKVVRE